MNGGPAPKHELRSDRVLAEPPEQDYVGGRDLTQWRTSAGRAAAQTARRSARRLAPHQVLITTLLGGLVVVAVLTTLAAEVYDAVVDADGVAGLDRPVLRFMVSARTDLGERIVSAYTWVGGPVVMPIVVLILAAALSIAWRQWTPVILILVTMAGSLTLTVLGKAFVGRTRPPFADAVPPLEDSASFPSGHALNSVALAGIVSYLLLRRLARVWARVLTIVLAAAFAVTMGLSRVYLGHHWLTDVLVAWALGLAWVAAVVTAHRLFLTLRRDRAAPVSDAAR